MSDESGVRLERRDAVAIITFDRASRRNVLDGESRDAISRHLRECNRDPETRAIVLAGSGRDYCTGADATSSNDAAASMAQLDYRFATVDFADFFRQLWELDTPVVTAVNGTVAGAGWMMALLADLVVAAQGARWTHVFTRRGMIPHAGDTYFLPRIIPLHRLSEIALLSDPVTSETLHEWGIVNRCVPADEVLETAVGLAQRLALGPTRSLAMTKRLYRRSLDLDIAAAMDAERSAQALISGTHDRREGLASFIENRPPNFNGQ